MVNFKKLSTSVVTAALSFGVLSSAVAAETPMNITGQPEQHERMPIRVASTETVISKNELIKRFKELFPNKFDFLSNEDFHNGTAHHYPGDNTIRYDLSFYKKIKGKSVSGSITFVGTDLEIEQFYYSPLNQKDALFPANVSKDEAKVIAQAFMKKFTAGKSYTLEETNNYYSYRPNQTLTEPIQYLFSFVRTENGINISDQRIDVTVLGNGEIVHFYRNPMSVNTSTFDDFSKVKAEPEITTKIKDNLSVNLQYQLNYDYLTGEQKVELVYNPSIQLRGINGITGEWQTANGFSATLPENKKIELISETPLKPKQTGVTVEEAKKMAEELLKIDSDKVKLTINSIEETVNYLGNEVINIQYSYEYANGAHGTSLEINKQTGEIVNYYNIKNEILRQIGEQPKNQRKLTEAQALTKAIEYLKEWVPSNLHNYAKPITEPFADPGFGAISFTFPRVVNGLTVSGDQLYVSINADGTLNNLTSNYQQNENWPSVDKVISEVEAKNRFIEALSLKLNYTKLENNLEDNHYYLVYTPQFNKNAFSYLDAITGEWNSQFVAEQPQTEASISHPTAEKELNHLIQNNILQVNDIEQFNGDSSITKGEALQVLVKSLTYTYEMHYPEQRNNTQTYENIGPEHPLYQVVERAVAIGILDEKNQGFNTDSKMTREQLAVWYIRALGLEKAAKYNNLYKLNVKDGDKVNPQYTGYVALAEQLGLLPKEKDLFNPKREVTYAELAVSVVRLAHELNESGIDLNRY